MFSKDELNNLKAIVAAAETKGVHAAAVVVSLFHKIDSLIKQNEEVTSGSHDVPNSSKSHPDAAA